MMKTMLVLFNYGARKVGITLIQNVYMSLLDEYGNNLLNR